MSSTGTHGYAQVKAFGGVYFVLATYIHSLIQYDQRPQDSQSPPELLFARNTVPDDLIICYILSTFKDTIVFP